MEKDRGTWFPGFFAFLDRGGVRVSVNGPRYEAAGDVSGVERHRPEAGPLKRKFHNYAGL